MAPAPTFAPLDTRLTESPGVGGLEVLRFEAVFEADRTGSALALSDTNYADRIGWREVVARAEHGARVTPSTVPSESASDALRAYPDDLLRSPLAVASAAIQFEPGSVPGRPPLLGSEPDY